jgi:hypothetical protein
MDVEEPRSAHLRVLGVRPSMLDLGRYLSLDNERPLDLLIWRLMGDNWTQHRIKQNQQLRQIARQLRRTR